MPFNCEKCYNVFFRQRDLDNHMNRKTPCISIKNKKDILCNFCNNGFSRTDNLKRHYSRCVVLNNPKLLIQYCENPISLLSEKDKIIEQMKVEIEELKSKIPNPVNEDNNLEKLKPDKTTKKSDDNSKCEELNVEKGGHFVYVIKERKFIKTKENIYKIGRTERGHSKRVSQYPKNSIVFNIIKVPDSKKYENEIKKIFKKKFIQRKDIGIEYFEANIASIREEIYKIVKRLDKSYK